VGIFLGLGGALSGLMKEMVELCSRSWKPGSCLKSSLETTRFFGNGFFLAETVWNSVRTSLVFRGMLISLS
jgi:hypothetical protein